MRDNSIIAFFKVIRWAIRTILVIFGVLPMAGCGSGYRDKDGKTTFNGKEITDKSFIVLNESFAKSATRVYYKERAFEYADLASFTALDEHYAKDKDKVYYCDEYREGQNYYLTKKQTIVTVQNAMIASFVNMKDDYAKDSNRAYYKGIGFDVKDAAGLTMINARFLKDKFQVYFEQLPVKLADPNSFRILNNSYAKDTNRIYYYGYHDEASNGIHEIPCKTESFSLLEYPYSKDDASVFYGHTKIIGSDANSFMIVGDGFSKDKNYVYAESKILKGADAATFMIVPHDENSLDEFNYTKDKNHVFYKDKMFAELNITNFKVLGLGYATDGKHIYFHTSVVRNADPATFKVYEHGYGEADAEDAVSKFHEGKKVVLEE